MEFRHFLSPFALKFERIYEKHLSEFYSVLHIFPSNILRIKKPVEYQLTRVGIFF